MAGGGNHTALVFTEGHLARERQLEVPLLHRDTAKPLDNYLLPAS